MKNMKIALLSIVASCTLIGMECNNNNFEGSFGIKRDSEEDILQKMDTAAKQLNSIKSLWQAELIGAVRSQRCDLLAKLLQYKAFCEAFKEQLNVSFVQASGQPEEDTNIKMMQLFLAVPQVAINYYDEIDNSTALSCAAIVGHVKSIRFLLSQPKINLHKNIGGKTVLELVKDLNPKNSAEIIKLLEQATNAKKNTFELAKEDDQERLFECLKDFTKK